MKELTQAECLCCKKPFTYVRVTKRRLTCSRRCSNKWFKRQENLDLSAIRSGTLNPRPSLQTCNSVASCPAVLVPPSPIPANDFAWTVEPPLPKQSWVFDVGGVIFHRLTQAETYARGHQPPVSIYCRPAAEKVAVNQ